MGWFSHVIYDGDETSSRHTDFLRNTGIFATEYLKQFADEFEKPKRRRSALNYFIKEAERFYKKK